MSHVAHANASHLDLCCLQIIKETIKKSCLTYECIPPRLVYPAADHHSRHSLLGSLHIPAAAVDNESRGTEKKVVIHV